MLNDTLNVLISIGIFGIILILLVTHIRNAKRIKKVRNTSVLLEELNKTNEKTHFHCCETKYTQSRMMLSKPAYDRYSCGHLLDDILLDAQHSFHKLLAKVKENREKYNDYKSEIDKLKSTITEEEAKRLGVPYQGYLEIEKALFAKQQLSPTVDVTLTCIVEYTSPAGRNHYSKSNTYSYTNVIQRLCALEEISKHKESETYKRKMERAKMTPKLRFAVIERDGRRCQICGAWQEDGAILHVDHIIPVARGGKTEMSNLWTLCDMCNLGKGTQILENDV